MSEPTQEGSTKRALAVRILESGSTTKALLILAAAGMGWHADQVSDRVTNEAKTVAKVVASEAREGDRDVAIELAVLRSQVRVVAQDLAAQSIDVAEIKATTGDLAAKIPAQLGQIRKRLERNEFDVAALKAGAERQH